MKERERRRKKRKEGREGGREGRKERKEGRKEMFMHKKKRDEVTRKKWVTASSTPEVRRVRAPLFTGYPHSSVDPGCVNIHNGGIYY